MGTSTSSSGAPSGVSFDPPWLSSVAGAIEPSVSVAEVSVALAPQARFKEARLNLYRYLSYGRTKDLKKSVSHYVNKGLGGARHATSRMRVPIAASVAMWSALQDFIDRETEKHDEWIDRVINSDDRLLALQRELAKKIVPDGGIIDEETCRESLAYALSEFQRENPEIDIAEINEESIFVILELFFAREVFCRYLLDVGQKIEGMEASKMVLVEKEIKQYIRASLTVKFRTISRRGARYSKVEMSSIVTSVLQETFVVFGNFEDE